MALPGASNPLESITNKLNDIEKKMDELTKKTGEGSSEDIKAIKKDMNDIATSMKAIVASIEDDKTRTQKRKEMVKDITKGVNTQLGDVSNSISNFNRDLGQKLSTLQFEASLKEDDAYLLRNVTSVLSTSNLSGRLAEIDDKIKRSGEHEVQRIQKSGEGTEEKVKQAKTEMYDAAHNGIKNVQNASYEGVQRVRNAANWLQHLYKNKGKYIFAAILIWICSVVGSISLLNKAYNIKTAAEQSLKNANEVINRIPDYRYWIIYKHRNPNTAAKFQKEADSLYSKKLYRETIE